MARRRSGRSGGSSPRKLNPPRNAEGDQPRSDNYVMPQADRRGASLNPNVPGAPRIGDTIEALTPLPGRFGANIRRGESKPVERIVIQESPSSDGAIEFVAPGAPPLTEAQREVFNEPVQVGQVQREVLIPETSASNTFTVNVERRQKRSGEYFVPSLVPTPYPITEKPPRRYNEPVDAEFILPDGRPNGRPILPGGSEIKQLPPAVQDAINKAVQDGERPYITNDTRRVFTYIDTRTPEGRLAYTRSPLYQNTLRQIQIDNPGAVVTPLPDGTITATTARGEIVRYEPKPSPRQFGWKFIPGPPVPVKTEFEEKSTEPITAQATAEYDRVETQTGEGSTDTGGRFYFGKGRLNFRRGRGN